MSQIKLSRSEEKVLVEAAGREGLLTFPLTMKDTTRQRMLGKLEAHGLIAASDDGGPVLTQEGYHAIGLKPPRRKGREKVAPLVPAAAVEPVESEAQGRRPTKQMLVVSLLARGGGASLHELMEATGWLPHTTRAALSRLRSSGQILVKSKREDGRTSYRIETDVAA